MENGSGEPTEKKQINDDLRENPDMGTKELAEKYDTAESYVSQLKSDRKE